MLRWRERLNVKSLHTSDIFVAGTLVPWELKMPNEGRAAPGQVLRRRSGHLLVPCAPRSSKELPSTPTQCSAAGATLLIQSWCLSPPLCEARLGTGTSAE